jgi:hypothetical protein
LWGDRFFPCEASRNSVIQLVKNSTNVRKFKLIVQFTELFDPHELPVVSLEPKSICAAVVRHETKIGSRKDAFDTKLISIHGNGRLAQTPDVLASYRVRDRYEITTILNSDCESRPCQNRSDTSNLMSSLGDNELDAQLVRELSELSGEFSLRRAWIQVHIAAKTPIPLTPYEFARKMDSLVQAHVLDVRLDDNQIDLYSASDPAPTRATRIVQMIRAATIEAPKTIAQITEESGEKEFIIRRYVPVLTAVEVLEKRSSQPSAFAWITQVEERLKNLNEAIKRLNRLRQTANPVRESVTGFHLISGRSLEGQTNEQDW